MGETVTQVRERPILFSGPMVRAILDGRKTQTRRVVKPQPPAKTTHVEWNTVAEAFVPWRLGESTPSSGHRVGAIVHRCPYGEPGDRLWVRETFRVTQYLHGVTLGIVRYGVDGALTNRRLSESDTIVQPTKGNRPSIHMPRWASRLTLEITDVRVERVQEISEDDSIGEGCDKLAAKHTARDEFRDLWDDLNLERGYGWDANPWVWVIGFRRVLGKREASS